MCYKIKPRGTPYKSRRDRKDAQKAFAALCEIISARKDDFSCSQKELYKKPHAALLTQVDDNLRSTCFIFSLLLTQPYLWYVQLPVKVLASSLIFCIKNMFNYGGLNSAAAEGCTHRQERTNFMNVQQ